MSELQRQLDAARRHVEPAWDSARVELAWTGLRRKQRRRRMRLAGVGAALVIAVAAGALSRVRTPDHPAARGPSLAPLVSVDGERVLRFRDGSEVALIDTDSKLAVVEESSVRITLELVNGRARCKVTRLPSRAFRVRVDEIVVVVVGTEFVVERAADGVRVAVLDGRVRVEAPDGVRELGAGQDAWFPRVAATPETPGPTIPSGPATHGRSPAPHGWRTLAEQGAYGEAYDMLHGPAAPKVRDRVDELLLAADVARLSGHPKDALPHLDRVVAAHATDPRSPLAAFTLGRVLLEQLGRPRQAAIAFATARSLDPDGSLAEDALAREVEGWHRSGETLRARERADEYLRRYPEGQRVKAVRRFGGVE